MKVAASPALPATNQELAEGIRGLVKGMPKIDTKRHELKQQLAKQFSREINQTQQLGHEAGQDAAKSSPEVPLKPASRDIER